MYALNPTAPLGAINRCRVVDWSYDRPGLEGHVWVEVGNVTAGQPPRIYPHAGHRYMLTLRNAGESVGLRVTADPESYLDRVQTFGRSVAGGLKGAAQAARAAAVSVTPDPLKSDDENKQAEDAAIAVALETYLRDSVVGLLPPGA